MPERVFLIFWFFLNFFLNFLARIEHERNSGLVFFFSFSAYLIPFWLKIMLGRGFLIFFASFFGILLPGSIMNGIRDKFFFFCCSRSISSRFGKKECQKRVLKFFEFFCYFFRNFLPRAEYERNSGQKVFPCFLSLSHHVLAKNNGGKSFFNFLIFFFYFFGNLLPGLSMNGIWD